MKVKCTSNHLSDILLTGYHRDQLASWFLGSTPPAWEAKPGADYTVYAIAIHRGCPFYFVAGTDIYQAYQFIPSICFEVLDPRLSSYWRIETRVMPYRGGEVFSTTLAFKEWWEPMFLDNLFDWRSDEVERMRSIAAEMDIEFGRYPPDRR